MHIGDISLGSFADSVIIALGLYRNNVNGVYPTGLSGSYTTIGGYWNYVTGEIDKGLPAMVTTPPWGTEYPGHTMVVCGYGTRADGSQYFLVHTGWYSGVVGGTPSYHALAELSVSQPIFAYRFRVSAGWHTDNSGNKRYFDINNVAKTGKQSIDGKTYYFDSTGTLAREDGVYTIETALSPSKLFDIAGGSTADSAVVQTGTLSRKPSQRFRLTYNNDGSYTIVNVNSNRALDIPGSNAASGVDVIQFLPTNNDNQKWLIVSTGLGDGSVYLVPKLNQALRLGIQSSSSATGMKIQLQTATTNAAQRFKLKEIKPVAGLGDYYTVEASYTNKVLDVAGGGIANGTNVTLYQSNGTAHQMFHFGYDSNTGYYTILDFSSGKALDVVGSGTAAGTNVTIFQRTGNYNQKWAIEKVADYYLIYSACNGLALDIDNKGSANGTNIQTWTPHGLDSQRFKLTSTTHSVDTSRLPDGIYTIKAAYTNKVLDVAGQATGPTWRFTRHTGEQTRNSSSPLMRPVAATSSPIRRQGWLLRL